MLHLAMEIALYQLRHGRYFVFEHPLHASSWDSASVNLVAEMPGVENLRIDMCHFGMNVTGDGLNFKPTGILSNHSGILEALRGSLCTGDHGHVTLWASSKSPSLPDGVGAGFNPRNPGHPAGGTCGGR